MIAIPQNLLHMFATWLKKRTCQHPIEKIEEGWFVQQVRFRRCSECGLSEVSSPDVDGEYKILKNYDPKYQAA